MQGFFSRRRNMLLGGCLIVLAVSVLFSGRENAGPVGRTLGLIGSPVQSLVGAVGSSIGRVVDHYIFLVGAREEAERLRAEVGELRTELMKVEEFRYENARLKRLLEFGEATQLEQVAASVVGRSASVWYRTLVLNKGSENGVAEGNPVVTASGVVGRVFEVSGGNCRVLMLTDASSAVDGVVQRSRDQVLVEGNMTPSPNLLYITRSSDVQIGDKIVTSGLDGIYPKGYLLGRVSDVTEEPGAFFLTASMEPTVDFARLEEVFIVTGGGEVSQ
ncbi:MAG: rod shape-determining protein MreC [Deltaproteobacteria bacterium]|nr:MAG: rod shape-determining protein MreC [Deltaproteobacteria bacterium]